MDILGWNGNSIGCLVRCCAYTSRLGSRLAGLPTIFFEILIREMANYYCRGSVYWTRNWIDSRRCVDWDVEKRTEIGGKSGGH